MIDLTVPEIDQLVYLLITNFFGALLLGSLLGWYIRGRYESWCWFKRGIYCDDCAPLVPPSKDQGEADHD